MQRPNLSSFQYAPSIVELPGHNDEPLIQLPGQAPQPLSSLPLTGQHQSQSQPSQPEHPVELKDSSIVQRWALRMVERMQAPDIINLTFPHRYQKLSDEFPEFIDEVPNLFMKIVKGEDIEMLSVMIFYMDEIKAGKITMERAEKEMGIILANLFMPPELLENNPAMNLNSV